MFEKYLHLLPYPLWSKVCKFGSCNHRLPIEAGRYGNIPRLERTHICSGKLGDEFHFIYECKNINELRRQYLNYNCVRHANILHFF